jgi:hypothetical protein
MPDTDFNITVDVTGNTAAIATDYTTSGVTNAHLQLMKLAFGGPTTATRVTTTSPFPVDIRSSNATVGVTGSVGGLGNFRVVNGISGASSLPLVVSGTTSTSYTPVQISGSVQGITNGVLLGVTGKVSLFDGQRIQGVTSGTPIEITGGRRLSSTTDSITVTGSVNFSGGRYMLQSTDSIRIYGASDGATVIPVSLRGSNNAILGSSGGALNVNLVNTSLGITANVSIAAIVGISQADQTVPLFVAGATTGPAIRVKGSSTEAVPVSWSSSLPVSIGNVVTINDTNLLSSINNLDIATVKSNTDKLVSIDTTLSGSGVNANIVSFSRSGTVHTGSLGLTAGVPVTPASGTLKTGVTLKAASSNGVDVLIKGNGANSTYGYPLSPADILFIETNNMNNISLYIATGTATVHYIAS